jgi:glycosyltransferase involved in cell wall biosynthesis
MEAMACEVPVVAVDVGAVTEVVEDRRTGLIAPALDDSALAEKTLTLLGDAALRRAMGLEGRRRAHHFSVEACADRYIEVFETAQAFRASRTRQGRKAIPFRPAM